MTKIRTLFAIAFISCSLLIASFIGIFICIGSEAYSSESMTYSAKIFYFDECSKIADDCAELLDGCTFNEGINKIQDKYSESDFGIFVNNFTLAGKTKNHSDNIVYRGSYQFTTSYDGTTTYYLSTVGNKTTVISVSIADDCNFSYIEIWNNRYAFIVWAAITGLIFVSSILLIGVFARKEQPLISPGFINRLPIPLYLLAGILIVILHLLFIFLIYKLTFSYTEIFKPIIILPILLASIVVTVFCGGIARRFALKRIYKEAIVYKIGKKYGIVSQGFVIGGYCIILIVFGMLFSYYVWPPMCIIITIIIAILWCLHIKNINELDKLIGRYCDGDWSKHPANDPLLFGNIYGKLCNLSASMQATVEKSVRNERTKTELITNVSHDIKTPLTSIINYTDLLKKEDLSEEARTEYLNVLSKNSARMKKLIEDLIEASKAATGNIELHPIECSIDTLLSQAIVEHEPDAELRKLKFVFIKNPEPVIINTDGKLLYRIFDNLLSNAVKYSLSGSRIYIDLVADDKLHIKFKNITEDQITVSPEELTERFVKGDMSRHSEGSGLGLAICKNLVELMGGKFEINIDGDQFTAVLILPLTPQNN